MKKRSAIIVAIVFMMIGFAAVSTTLIINGNAKVSENNEDFSVIFTAATLDGKDVYSSAVDDTKKAITFISKNLMRVGDTSTLTYEVTNNSANYDAEVKVTCVPKTGTTTKYTSIKNELENDAAIVKAKTSLNGTLTITLNKTVMEETTEEYKCSLEFNAVERNALAKAKNNYILTKADGNTSKYAEIGDTISIENEKFYVISNNNHIVSALAYYNLNIGNNSVAGTIGIQNENAKGWNAGNVSPYPGSVKFSNNNNWNFDNNGAINIREQEGQIKAALYDETDGYENYIKSFGIKATIRMASKGELENLGCTSGGSGCLNSQYPWIYTSSYWLSTPDSNDSAKVYVVYSESSMITREFNYDSMDFGVRPVIEFSENL